MAKDKQPGIREVYDPPEDEKLDLKHVYERKREMERGRPDDKWDEWMRQYESYRPDKAEDEWQSDIYVPTTTSIIEAQLSEMIDQNIRPRVLARGVEDKPKATVMNSVIDYTWEIGRADIEVYKLIKNALIYGTGVAQEYYRRETRDVEQLVEISPTEGEKYEKVTINDFDDVYMETLRLQDFFVDEKARSFNGSYAAKDAVRRYVMREDEFKNFFKGKVWDPLNNVKKVRRGGDTNYYEFFKPPEAEDQQDLIEVLWYWSVGPTPGEPDRADNLIIVANDVCIRRGPMPYAHKKLPFVRAVDILKPDHFYGKGECELLESIQEEQNTLRRQILDRNHLDIDKTFLVSSQETGLDEEDVIARPHGIIPVNDPDLIKPLEYSDVPRSVQISLEQLKDDAVRVTGQDDRMTSVQTLGTATEAAILKEATLKRLRSKMWLLRNTAIYQVGMLRESNIRQYYTVPKVEKIVGEKSTEDYKKAVREAYKQGRLKMIEGEPYREKYRTIRLQDEALEVDEKSGEVKVRKNRGSTFFEVVPELIVPYHGRFDVKVQASPHMELSKPIQQERVSMMYDRLVQNPAYSPMKLGDALLEAHDYDPDDFKPEPPMQERMQRGMVEKSIELASVENKEMLKGEALPPTPYAPEPHTEVHVAMLNSPQIMDMPPDSPIFANFVRHIQGEILAQQQRDQAVQKGRQQRLEGGPVGPGGEYKPPSGPTAVKQRGQTAIPAVAEREQNANALGRGMS